MPHPFLIGIYELVQYLYQFIIFTCTGSRISGINSWAILPELHFVISFSYFLVQLVYLHCHFTSTETWQTEIWPKMLISTIQIAPPPTRLRFWRTDSMFVSSRCPVFRTVSRIKRMVLPNLRILCLWSRLFIYSSTSIHTFSTFFLFWLHWVPRYQLLSL